MKITLPELPEGAEKWNVYAVTSEWETPEDTRSLYHRTIYLLLMFIHDKAESLWHWCYRVSKRFAPPEPKRSGEAYRQLL